MVALVDIEQARKRLDYYYHMVKEIILDRQHPVTGLIPASVAITTHGYDIHGLAFT
jgi:hypothetical protein